jgi:hypothetical protein
MFKTKIKFNKKEIDKMVKWLKEYIEYRGGMGNRINALMILEKLKNKKKNLKRT